GSKSMALRAPQMGLSIQRRGLEEEFRSLLRERSRTQRRPKESLDAKEGRLGQTAPMIARLVLPPPSAFLPNGPQVLIARVRRSRAVAMLPDLGIPARWDHGFGAPLLDRLVAAPFVISATGTD